MFTPTKYTRFWLALGLVCLLLLVWGLIKSQDPIKNLMGATEEGTLTFSVDEFVQVNEPFMVTVAMDTQGNAVNAVGLNLVFDPDYLQLTQLDSRSSFCQFYPQKVYDNQTGTINLACGSPHPGVTGTNTLMLLEFIPLRLGTTTLRTAEGSAILMSDGKGTNILTKYPIQEIKIGNLP